MAEMIESGRLEAMPAHSHEENIGEANITDPTLIVNLSTILEIGQEVKIIYNGKKVAVLKITGIGQAIGRALENNSEKVEPVQDPANTYGGWSPSN